MASMLRNRSGAFLLGILALAVFVFSNLSISALTGIRIDLTQDKLNMLVSAGVSVYHYIHVQGTIAFVPWGYVTISAANDSNVVGLRLSIAHASAKPLNYLKSMMAPLYQLAAKKPDLIGKSLKTLISLVDQAWSMAESQGQPMAYSYDHITKVVAG